METSHLIQCRLPKFMLVQCSVYALESAGDRILTFILDMVSSSRLLWKQWTSHITYSQQISIKTQRSKYTQNLTSVRPIIRVSLRWSSWLREVTLGFNLISLFCLVGHVRNILKIPLYKCLCCCENSEWVLTRATGYPQSIKSSTRIGGGKGLRKCWGGRVKTIEENRIRQKLRYYIFLSPFLWPCYFYN